jgi:uncharacterized protein (TIGR02996 family)
MMDIVLMRIHAVAANPSGLATSDGTVNVMIGDQTLDGLRRSVLEDPKENTGRWIYADRLDELGCRDEAAMIRSQLEHPAEALTVAGAAIGLPLATTATYRRGFVDEVTVLVDHLGQLGDVVRDHPVARVHVLGTGLLVRIACREPGPPGGPDGTGRGHPGRRPQRWVVQTRLDPPDYRMQSFARPSTRRWNSRAKLVKRIGPAVADYMARVNVECVARFAAACELRLHAYPIGYRAGQAWADSGATRQQLRRLAGPLPIDAAKAVHMHAGEMLYLWVFGRLGDWSDGLDFWDAVVGDESDVAEADNDTFVLGFRMGALARQEEGQCARSDRRSRVDPPPGP